jgi:ankyrin repeat protein
MTALLHAIVNGDGPLAERLLAEGADVDAATSDGWTPLMKACLWERAELVALLLAHGASADAQSVDGWSALAIARHKRNDLIVRLLTRHVPS